jgi:hypothetical protein
MPGHTPGVCLARGKTFTHFFYAIHFYTRTSPYAVVTKKFGNLLSLAVIDIVAVGGDQPFALALDQ